MVGRPLGVNWESKKTHKKRPLAFARGLKDICYYSVNSSGILY